MKKVTLIFILTVLVLSLFTACGDKSSNDTNATTSSAPVNETLPPAESWTKAYAEFLENPKNYTEKEHDAGQFAFTDMDNDGTPELIIAYYNGIEGGTIFANIYSYDGNVNMIGNRIDMYYKFCYAPSDLSISGLFVEGGRSSSFACNYWSVKNNKLVEEPLWTDNANTGKMEHKELSDNSQLIEEAKRAISGSGIEFFEISKVRVQEN